MPRATRPSFRAPSVFLLAAALTAALLFPACTSKEPAPPAVPADLAKHPVYSTYDFGGGPKVIHFATQPLAAPEGPLGEAMARDLTLQRDLSRLGFRIRFHPFLKGGDLNFFMDRGKIQAAIAGDMPTLLMASKSAIRVGSLAKLGYGAVVMRNGTLVEDLRGKRIGNVPGTTGHFTLLEAIRKAGLKESDVTVVPMDVNAMTAALSRNEIDGFSAWEPAPSIAVATVHGTNKVFRMANSSYIYFSRHFAEENPEATRTIVASIIRSVNWMREDHQNLVKASRWALSATETLAPGGNGATIEQIAMLTSEDLLDLAEAPRIPSTHIRTDGPLHKEFLFLQSQGKIPSAVAWETAGACFDLVLAKSVFSFPEQYNLRDYLYSPDTP